MGLLYCESIDARPHIVFRYGGAGGVVKSRSVGGFASRTSVESESDRAEAVSVKTYFKRGGNQRKRNR